MIGQHDERRQIVVHAAQAVTDPAAHAGKAGQLETGGLQQRRLAVDARLADHVVHEGHVVDTRPEIRDDVAEHLAALAVRLKLPDWSLPRPESILKSFDRFAEIGRPHRAA